MGIMVIAAYRPRPGDEARLLELAKEHHPILRQQDLVAERRPYAMRANDGTIIEVFEWKSQAAIDEAHANPEVLKMWERYSPVCEFVPMVSVNECRAMFAMFEAVEL